MKKEVYETAQLIAFFLESHRKCVGTLFHIPDTEVGRLSDIQSQMARMTKFVKSKIAEMVDEKHAGG